MKKSAENSGKSEIERPISKYNGTEQVGWIRYDGDEYHGFIYASPNDRKAPKEAFRDLLPVYVNTPDTTPQEADNG